MYGRLIVFVCLDLLKEGKAIRNVAHLNSISAFRQIYKQTRSLIPTEGGTRCVLFKESPHEYYFYTY
jgi:hypothetical protein